MSVLIEWWNAFAGCLAAWSKLIVIGTTGRVLTRATKENARRLPDTSYLSMQYLTVTRWNLFLVGVDDPLNSYAAQGYRNHDTTKKKCNRY
jgi:hypothetical protein